MADAKAGLPSLIPLHVIALAPVPLPLQVIKGPVTRHFPEGAQRVGFSHKSDSIVPLQVQPPSSSVTLSRQERQISKVC